MNQIILAHISYCYESASQFAKLLIRYPYGYVYVIRKRSRKHILTDSNLQNWKQFEDFSEFSNLNFP